MKTRGDALKARGRANDARRGFLKQLAIGGVAVVAFANDAASLMRQLVEWRSALPRARRILEAEGTAHGGSHVVGVSEAVQMTERVQVRVIGAAKKLG